MELNELENRVTHGSLVYNWQYPCSEVVKSVPGVAGGLHPHGLPCLLQCHSNGDIHVVVAVCTNDLYAEGEPVLVEPEGYVGGGKLHDVVDADVAHTLEEGTRGVFGAEHHRIMHWCWPREGRGDDDSGDTGTLFRGKECVQVCAQGLAFRHDFGSVARE